MAQRNHSKVSGAAKFAVGIDLGTTHCALSFAPLAGGGRGGGALQRPESFAIAQVVRAGEVASQPLLPSCLYLPAAAELPAGALALPWDAAAAGEVVGVFAREAGSGAPLRLVASAKSWLSYAGVDRRGAILPWGSPDGVARLSPLEASAKFLAHLRAAWDASQPEAPLAEQEVVLTVPASFDAVARELTVEAAQLAGLSDSTCLLEEPQAALYGWLAHLGGAWREQVEVGDVILVCDIGGGTTDFSLIAVGSQEGHLTLERIAVGEHLLLGGDNIDLALAYAVRARLEQEGTRLDDWQMRVLTHACRAAKENLTTPALADSFPVVIPGRGSRLVGGAVRNHITRDELDRVLLEGFFPQVESAARPQAPRRAGLTALGLPYANDPAITRHLAAFLGRAGLPKKSGHTLVHPTAVLFNGGVTRSALLQQRLCSVLTQWMEAEGGQAPRVLATEDLDLAVSRGAAYYAAVRHHGGVRIRGGTAQAYFVGIERPELAVPGVAPRLDALCVAPCGMEEGSQAELPQSLGLVVGEPVSFRFFSATGGAAESTSGAGDYGVGSVADPQELTELAPIETTLEGEAGRLAQVRLHARVTAVGTLELFAVEQPAGQRWKLSFNVRVE